MPILNRRELTKVLRAALSNATGRVVEVLRVPDDPAMPYGILYPVGGGRFYGPQFAAPDEDVDVVYQVTTVGGSRDVHQADWMADRVRRFFLERHPEGEFVEAIPAPDGWKVDDRWPDAAGPPPLEAADQGLYQVAERFVLRLTPA